MDAVSQATFATEVVEASRLRPVLVDVWEPRCEPCRELMPWVERLAAELHPAAHIVSLDTSRNRPLGRQLGLSHPPAFLLYRDGHEVQRLTGDDCTSRGVLGLLQTHVRSAALTAGITD